MIILVLSKSTPVADIQNSHFVSEGSLPKENRPNLTPSRRQPSIPFPEPDTATLALGTSNVYRLLLRICQRMLQFRILVLQYCIFVPQSHVLPFNFTEPGSNAFERVFVDNS